MVQGVDDDARRLDRATEGAHDWKRQHDLDLLVRSCSEANLHDLFLGLVLLKAILRQPDV